MRGRSRTGWWGVVLDAPDGVALARFYSALLGWPIAQQEGGEAAIAVPGTTSYLAFQSEPKYVRPVWPADGQHQQMMLHLDIAVDELAAAVPTPSSWARLCRSSSRRTTSGCCSTRPAIRSASTTTTSSTSSRAARGSALSGR